MQKPLKITVVIIALLVCFPLIMLALGVLSSFFSIQIETPREKVQKIIEEARDKKDIELCYKIRGRSNSVEMGECNLAIEMRNEDLCEKIPWAQQWYGEIKEACYKDVAKSLNNPSICEKSGSYKDYCYFDIATKTNKIEVCKRMSDFLFRKNCIYKVAINTLNVKLCEQVNKIDRKDCIKEVKEGIRGEEAKRFPPDTKPDLIISNIKIPTSVG